MATTNIGLGNLTTNTTSPWVAVDMAGEVIIAVHGTFGGGTCTIQGAFSDSPAAAEIMSLDASGTNDDFTEPELKLFTVPAGPFYLRMNLTGATTPDIDGFVRDSRSR